MQNLAKNTLSTYRTKTFISDESLRFLHGYPIEVLIALGNELLYPLTGKTF